MPVASPYASNASVAALQKSIDDLAKKITPAATPSPTGQPNVSNPFSDTQHEITLDALQTDLNKPKTSSDSFSVDNPLSGNTLSEITDYSKMGGVALLGFLAVILLFRLIKKQHLL